MQTIMPGAGFEPARISASSSAKSWRDAPYPHDQSYIDASIRRTKVLSVYHFHHPGPVFRGSCSRPLHPRKRGLRSRVPFATPTMKTPPDACTHPLAVHAGPRSLRQSNRPSPALWLGVQSPLRPKLPRRSIATRDDRLRVELPDRQRKPHLRRAPSRLGRPLCPSP